MSEAEPSDFGALAVRRGLLREEQLARAVEIQARLQRAGVRKRLGEICVQEGFLSLEQVLSLIGAQGKRILSCTGCGQRYNVPVAIAAQKHACRKCGQPLGDPAVRGLDADETNFAATVRMGAPAVPSELTSAIPGYVIAERLGAGGMGAVYKAKQLALDRWVAVKLMKRELAEDPGYVKRFLAEARTTGKLRHENIVSALDCGESKSGFYIVMEFVEGRPLDAIVQERGRLPEREALEIGRKVALALDYAWEQHRIIHRDIKPQNILLTNDGKPKICDLGLCRDLTSDASLTATGTIACSPAYASPEQARGEKDLDSRSDIYSLGATLYHLVTGAAPFEGQSPGDVLIKQATQAPVPPIAKAPGLSPGANALILRMLEKARERRPATFAEVADRIAAVLSGAPAPLRIRPSTRARRDPSRTRRSRSSITAAVVSVVLLVAGIALLLALRRPAAPAASAKDPHAARFDELRTRSLNPPEDPAACFSLLEEWRTLERTCSAELRPKVSSAEKEVRGAVENRVLARLESPRREERLMEALSIAEPYRKRGFPRLDETAADLETAIARRVAADLPELERAPTPARWEALAKVASILQGGVRRWFTPELGAKMARVEAELAARKTAANILLVRRDSKGSRFEIVSPEAQTRLPLVDLEAPVSDPTWSPDGTRIVFRSRGDLFLCRADGTEIRRLTETPGIESRACWSPDGRGLLYSVEVNGRSRVHSLDLNSRTGRALSPEEEDARWPDMTPDGGQAVYIRHQGDGLGKVVVFDVRRDAILSALDVEKGARCAVWAPDGRRVAVVYRRASGWGAGEMTPADGRFGFSVTFDDAVLELSAPSWSPDGSVFVGSARKANSADVYFLDTWNRQVGRLNLANPEGVFDSDPAWKPAKR